MVDRPAANGEFEVSKLLNLLENRFDIRLDGSVEHLRSVREHYLSKRRSMLVEYGEAVALSMPDYAKAYLISEAARMMILKEIMPRPTKKRKRQK